MKKSAIVLALALLGGAILPGCVGVEVCHSGANMVMIQNHGCFLFACLPLCSGDPDYPNQDVSNWFSNTVKLETNMRLLRETAEREGATGVRNLASHLDDEWIFCPVIKRKIYKTSAELVK